MGHAVDNLARQSAQATSTRRQRHSKPGNSAAHYTGNLVAYRHDLTALNSLVASSAKPTPPAPVDVNPVSEAKNRQTTAKTTIAATVAANSSYDARPGLLQNAKATLMQRAVPITGCLCLVGVAGLTWYLLDATATTDVQQPSTITDNTANSSPGNQDEPIATPDVSVQEIAVTPSAEQPAEAITTTAEPAVLPDTPELTVGESAVSEPDVITAPTATPDFAAEFREEIDWLYGQNVDLRGQIVVLKQETLELHEEIFQRELEQLAQEAEAKESGKPNVVYQYVDLPLGAHVAVSEPAEYDGGYGDSPADVSASTTSAPSLTSAMPSVPTDLPPPPILGSADKEIAFDPETGFYIDPNYTNNDYTGSDLNAQSQVNELASKISARVEYPPIAYE